MNQVEKAKITKLIQIINWEDTENSIRPMLSDFCSIYNEFHSTNAVGTEDERVQQLNEFCAWCNEIADMLSPQQAVILFNELRKNGIFFQDFEITDTASKFVLDSEIGKAGVIVNWQGLVHKVLSNLYQKATQYEPILGLPSKNTYFYQWVSRNMLAALFCNLHFEQYCTDVWYQSFDCILKEIVRIDHDTARKEIESALERLLTVVDNENDYYAVFEAYYNRLKNRHDNKRIENDDYNIAKMKTIDLNALLKTIKKAVSDQNSQVPTILVTGDSKFLVDVIRAEYSSCYSVCGHPQDESKSYYFLKPAECDLYYFVYTRFNEFGDLQYAIDIATKGHKPSFIILDNNSEYKYFPKDILEKYPTFSVSFMNSLFPPLQKFVDSLNSSIRDTLPEYAWINISQFWKHEFSRLYLGKDFITLGENSPIFNQKKWENWYNDEVFKLEESLSGDPQIKLPGFPVRYVSSFPSKKDRMQIVKEQLVMSAIEGALTSCCNPEAIVKPLLEFFDIDNYVCPNQELYLRECLKEAKGFEMLSTYHQLIPILIEKCSHSTSLKYSDELEQLLVDTYQSVKVEEAKVEDSIILLLDIATRIRNLRNYNIKGSDGYFVKRAKELSVVSEVSVDLAKQIEDMAKPYIEEENEFMMNCLNLDSIEYSDELKSNLII